MMSPGQERQSPSATVPQIEPGIGAEILWPSRALGPWHKPVFILCLIAWAGNIVLTVLHVERVPVERWFGGLFLVFATGSTLLTLGRRLPMQNVVATATVVTLISGGVTSLAALSGIPFGPVHYSVHFGEQLFGILPWPLLLGWTFVIINGRGIARLIMRPWRKTNYYGFWVMGVTGLLAVLLDLALEPLAVYVKSFWIWQSPRTSLAWYTAPWVNFLGWFVATIAILIFSLPWLINKHPVKQPTDYQPLVLWLLLNTWLTLENALHQLWPAVLVSLIGNAVMTIYAIRGARW